MARGKWTRRTGILSELLRFAEYLQIELIYHERLLPDILHAWQDQCRRADLRFFFAVWEDNWRDGRGAIALGMAELGLNDAERYQLSLLVESLGYSTLEEQSRLLQLFRENTQGLLFICRQDEARFGRLWRYCGVFSAAILAILLL